MSIVNCTRCNKPIERTLPQLRITRNPFCSRKCYWESRSVMYSANPATRFWRYVEKRDPGVCWEWTGNKSPYGYGRLQYKRNGHPKVVLAHRFSYALHYGQFPDELHVLHTCDNPGCVNPSHLFLGTNLDNIHDRMQKGRSHRKGVGRGEAHPRAKLTWAAVRYIRAHHGVDETTAQLAQRFNVCTSNILLVAKGTAWIGDGPTEKT
jgi:hypothetical protein